MELSGCDSWIVQTLTGDAALQAIMAGLWAQLQQPIVTPAPATRPDRWVYANVAPEGALFPYITFSLQAAKDNLGAFGQRILVDARYLVRVVMPGMGPGALYPAANRIDALLSTGTVNAVVAGVTIMGCTRVESIRMEHALENVRYQFVGGMYRILMYS